MSILNSKNLNLFYSYNCQVDAAYIITVKGNKASEDYSERCQASCENVSMPYTVWDAFNGIEPEIVVPDHSIGESITKMLKVTDHYLTNKYRASLPMLVKVPIIILYVVLTLMPSTLLLQKI